MYIYSLVPLFTLCLYSSASPISSSQIDSDLISVIGSTLYAQSTPEPTPWSYTPPPPIHPSTDGTCGPSNNSVCDREGKAPCCSQFGWCGKGLQWCGVGCQDEFGRCDENTSPEVKGVSLDGSCGGEKRWTCNGSSSGPCCSSYGWCGTSEDHCGLGCQSLFGNCSPVVSSSLPSLPSIAVPSSAVETIVSSFAALPSTGTVTSAGDTIVLITSTIVVSPIPATKTGDFSPILSPSSLSEFIFSPGFATSLPFSEVTPINSVPRITTHIESPSVLSKVIGPTISAPEESEETLVPSASEAGSISSGSEESDIANTAYPTITSDILSFSTAVASSYGSLIPSEEDDLPDCNESVTSSLTDEDYISTTDKEIKTGFTELPSIRSASSVGYPSQYDAEFSNTEIIAPTTGPIAPASSELSFSESAVESTPSTLASPSNSGSILTDYPTYTDFPILSSPASVDNFPEGSVGLLSHAYPSEVITDLPASTGVPIFSSLSSIYDVSDSLVASSTETSPGDVVTELPTVTSLPLFSLSSATYRLGSESSTPGVDILSSDGVKTPLTSLSLVLPSVSVETSSSIEVSFTIPTSKPIFVSPIVSLSQIPVPESTDTLPEGYPTTSLSVPESSITADASATSQYDNIPSPSILLPTSLTTPLPSSSSATTTDLPTNSEFTSSTISLPSSKSYTKTKPWTSLPATKQPRPIGGVNPLSVFFAENIFPFKHGHYEKHKATTSLKSYISSITKDAISSPTSTVKNKKPIHNKEKRGRVVTTDLFTEDVVVAKTHSRTTIHVLTDFQTKTSDTKVSKTTTD